MKDEKIAYVSNIQHFNVHDGRGFRTTVFLQGCALRCAWCQNPELLSEKPTMMFSDSLCTGCLACVSACPQHALQYKDEGINYDAKSCQHCYQCEQECYFLARTFSSHRMSVEEVYKEAVKDKDFYLRGGGVTLSGGEPLLQDDFCKELSQRLIEQEIRVTIETAGFCPWENIQSVLPYTEFFFYDLKLITLELRRQYLGTTSSLMLNNLIKLSKTDANIILRIPLIPDVNDTQSEFSKLLVFSSRLRRVHEIHLLPFHQFGAGKYELLNRTYRMKNRKEESIERIQKCKDMAEAAGFLINVGGSGIPYEE